MKPQEPTSCQYCATQLANPKFFRDQQPVCQSCYLALQNISSTDFDRQKLLTNNRVHIDDPLAISNLKKIINHQLQLKYHADHQKLIVACIGTDRSTGDALGPLVGSKLTKFRFNNSVDILGTLENPVHATNLQDQIEKIQHKYNNPFIIAIDAGLGKNNSVGSISVKNGPLQPGTGVDKKLPEIGNLHITGLVNVAGYMEYFVLQSTRLNIVFKMSKIISYALAKTLK
ncbi:spore protease YyaC [Halanaerobaculum tunisiense]